eukprot:scaffold113876_cov16-Tisochrysis_lutea.AAC.2
MQRQWVSDYAGCHEARASALCFEGEIGRNCELCRHEFVVAERRVGAFVFKLGSKRRGCHWAQSLAYRLGSTDPSMHMRLVEALAEHGRAAL